jgi:drug/metabolite transporter (DMT)-like permease
VSAVAERHSVATNGPTLRRSGLALALIAAMVSGVAVYVNGEAISRFPSPTVYTTGKNLVAGVVLAIIAAAFVRHDRANREALPKRPLDQRQMFGLFVVAVIGGAVPFVLFFEGLARATSSDAAFIHKTLVVWVAVFAVVVLRERVTLVHLGAVLLLVVAQIVVADGVGSLRSGSGEAMILAATLCWSVELIVVKRLVESVHSTFVAAWRIGGGAVLLLTWMSVTGRLELLTELSASQWAWLALTGSLLSVFVSVWFAAVARAQVVDVAAILVLGAVVTGAIDLAAGGAVVPLKVVGWLLIFVSVGAVITQRTLDDRRRVLA